VVVAATALKVFGGIYQGVLLGLWDVFEGVEMAYGASEGSLIRLDFSRGNIDKKVQTV
jgi:hypothetical protein